MTAIKTSHVLVASIGDVANDAFALPVGHHDPTWLTRRAGGYLVPDRPITTALSTFVGRVAQLSNLIPTAATLPVGTAFMRIVDAGTPQHMTWHVDGSEDGGVRFTAAISTDNHDVAMAFTRDRRAIGRLTDPDRDDYWRPDNGVIVAFTVDTIHGVINPPSRPGERTAVFFATLYPDREVADLHSSNANPDGHDALPRLGPTRRVI